MSERPAMPSPREKKTEPIKTGIEILDQVLKEESVKKAGSITLDDIAKSPQMREYQSRVKIAQTKIGWNDDEIKKIEALGIPEPNVEPGRFKQYQAFKKEKQRWEEVISNIKLEIGQKLMVTNMIKNSMK